MVKAIFNGIVIAEADKTPVVEGNPYFPRESIKVEYFADSARNLTTVCPWKGTAQYYDIIVDGETATDAAWYYPDASDAAKQIQDHVAFYGSKVDIVRE